MPPADELPGAPPLPPTDVMNEPNDEVPPVLPYALLEPLILAPPAPTTME